MQKYKKLWLGLMSIGLSLLMFIVLVIVQRSMQEEPVYEKVLCAKKEITSDILLKEENISQYVEVRDIPVTYLPDGYLKANTKLDHKMLLFCVSEGTVLTKNMIEDFLPKEEKYQTLMWVSVPIKELYEGVAGTLRPGDYIDIYAVRKEGEEMQSNLLAEHVRIKETYNTQGTLVGDEKTGLSQLIVIPLEKKEVATFYEMLAKGNIRIAKYEES